LTVVSVGCFVTDGVTGAGVTVSTPGTDVAVPAPLKNRARYWSPEFPVVVGGVVYALVIVVAERKLLVGSPGALDHVFPPSFETCHWTLRTEPVAVAVKSPSWPATIDWFAGAVVTAGGITTLNVPAWLVTDPATLAKTTRNCAPANVRATAGSVNVVTTVVPVTVVWTIDFAVVVNSNQVEPLSVDRCHVAVGAGDPDAVTVKLALLFKLTVTLAGCTFTVGPVTTAYVTMFETLCGMVPFHFALYTCVPLGGLGIVTLAVPVVPLIWAVAMLFAPSKKLTVPRELTGATVAVRVTGVPFATGLEGVAARVIPDIVTDPMPAGAETATHVYRTPEVNATELIATGTIDPGGPETPVTVPERLVHVMVSSPPTLTGFAGGADALPLGEKPTTAVFTVLVVLRPEPGSI